jgi:hypothetical protein
MAMSGPSATVLSEPSVTTAAISRITDVSGLRPVISRSILTKRSPNSALQAKGWPRTIREMTFPVNLRVFKENSILISDETKDTLPGQKVDLLRPVPEQTGAKRFTIRRIESKISLCSEFMAIYVLDIFISINYL